MVAEATSAHGQLVLRRGGEDDGLELRVNGVFVMDGRETTSERALAALALAATTEPVHVLVAGLGLGFTLRQVLADERVRKVSLVELEPALVAWARADLVPGGAAMLSDARVETRIGDVRDQIAAAAQGSVDVVLLDVDNGPDFLVHTSNAHLYRPAFLSRCAGALSPAGVLAVWSMRDSPELRRALESVFADVRLHACAVRLQGRTDTYWVSVARGPRQPAPDREAAAGQVGLASPS